MPQKPGTSDPVINPNLGLFFDRGPLAIPQKGLKDGYNFRVKEGALTNRNLGWSELDTDIQLLYDGVNAKPVALISNATFQGVGEKLIFGTALDLYVYDPDAHTVTFINEQYDTGTVELVGTAVSTAGGTNLGDLTGGGGLAAAFDGTTAQAAAACATEAASTDAWVGKTLASTSAISKAVVYGSNDAGFVSAINPTVTLDLYGKTGAAPASATDGTLLGTASFTDTADESAGRTVTTSDATVWTHVWVRVTHNGAANQINVAEVKLFARTGTSVVGSGTNWDPEAKAGDYIHFGDANYANPTGTWSHVAARNSDTSLTLTTARATVAAGAAYTIRKTFTGDLQDVWVTQVFLDAQPADEDLWFATNGVDDVVTWNGTDATVTAQTALGITGVKTIVIYSNMMMYANFISSGERFPASVRNSVPGSPVDITTGIAEEFKVHDGVEGIVDMTVLGDNVCFYSPRHIVLGQFVGDPLIFLFRVISTGIGPKSQRVIADFGDYHHFMAADAGYTFDGVTVEEVNPQVWRDIIRRSDPSRRNLSYAHFDEENGDLIWVIAQTSDPNSSSEEGAPETAFVQHYLEEVGPRDNEPFSSRRLPFTASGYFERQTGLTWDQLTDTWAEAGFRWNDQLFQANFPLNLFGDADGKIYVINTQQNEATGTALPAFVRFGRVATFDGHMRALITRVYPFTQVETPPLDVTLHLTDHPGGATTPSDTLEFDQSHPEGLYFVTPYRCARYVELEFGSDGPSEPWTLEGYATEVRSGGYR